MFAQLVGSERMLTDYDARAVAEVMGIAFVRGPGTAPPSPTRRARAAKPVAGVAGGDFVVVVDGGNALRIVEVGGDAGSVPSERRGGRAARPGAVEELFPPTPALIEKAVEAGLPRGVLRHVAEHLAGDDKAKVSRLEWGVVPKTTLERRETQLSPEESERTERVARLLVHARRALGTEEEAREFMTTPHPRLDGRSPVEAARTDLGTRRTEGILNALEYGLAL